MASTPLKNPTYEEISERARAIWESRGRPEGRDDEIWLDAERELQRDAVVADQELSSTSSTPAGAKSGKEAGQSSKPRPRQAQRQDADDSRAAQNEPVRENYRDPSNYADA